MARAEERLALLAATAAVSYTLDVLNSQAGLLYSQPVVLDEGDEQGDFRTFAELIPWPAGAATVVLKGDGAALDQRSASAHAPAVQLLWPNGGETLQSPAVVRWEAADEDGDTLTFHLLYSPDAGANWQAIALDVLGRAYTLTAGADGAGWLPGSTQALMRVIASDGVLTGRDDSDRPFTVAGRAPIVAIQAPLTGSQHPVTRSLILDGVAEDSEEGLLHGASLTWRSDRDGLLGRGEELWLAPGRLSFGRHVITLSATDSDGMSTRASVEIFVEPLRRYLPLLRR
jgi:hypothetical protein